MEDMEARREARRKRILQSSEDRLNRVLGQQGENRLEDQGVSSELVSGTKEADSSLTSSAGNPTEIRHRKPTSGNEGVTDESKSEDAKKSSRSTVKVSPIKKPHTAVVDNDVKVTANNSINTSRSTSEAKMMLKHFEFLRIVLCFIVAFLCRRVLATGYGIFYVQTIVIPFACMETGFFMFKHKVLHNVILPHRSSMLVGLLMLCGLKPNVVQLYNKTMGYITAATEDFALFFFAFMMANTFLV